MSVELIYDIILIITALILAFAGTGAAYALLRKFQVMDTPNARSNHVTPTPRGGGLGIVFALGVLLPVTGAPFPLVAAFLWLALVSFVDDLRGLSARLRLLVQVAAVFWVLMRAYGGSIAEWLPIWVEIPLLALAWLWFINLFNFMDGSDGLAASEATCIALGIVAVAAGGSLLSFHAGLVAAAAFGFLLWNWHPARVFLGDVGSVPLGFLLGFLLIALAGNGELAAALILPAVFVLDASVTLLRRLCRGEKIFEAHSQHAYQRAIRAGMGHDAVARDVIGVNLLLILLAVLSSCGTWAAWACLIAAYGLAAAVLYGHFIRQERRAA